MLKKILLPTILIVLAYGFWISPDFKEISAGVAIFLFGMLSLEEGFKVFSGGLLEKILQKSTNKLWKSISFGFVATTIMQSSSLVSVITISFLGAGLIGLVQGIGIILGANIGTTTGAWLMAGFGLKVKISAYAMPMLVFGVILIFQKAKSLKGIGYILAGLGFLFLGIHHMKEGFEAFKETIDLAAFSVPGFKGLLIFIGIGILATVVMQSSHATIVIILAALSVGQITYENALALTIGANIGTTITAVIGSLSSNIDGKRLAGAHFIFNVVTAVIAVVIMDQIMLIVEHISNFLGIAPDNHTLKLAVFDSFFKIMGVVLFIPFINTLVDFLEKSLKPKVKLEQEIDEAKYLNDSVLELPATALVAVLRETKHLYNNAFEIIAHGLNMHRKNIISDKSYEEVIKEPYSQEAFDINLFYNNKIKGLYGEILDFSSQAQAQMSPDEISNLYKIKLANRDIVEAVKDAGNLQKNLLKYTKADNKNESIKNEYMMIQKGLVEMLRGIDKIAHFSEEEDIIVEIGKLKLSLEQYDLLANGTLDKLIRQSLITNEMATSLMNDSAYAYDISTKLLSMAEIIYLDTQSEIDSISSELNIDDEIDSLLAQKEIK